MSEELNETPEMYSAAHLHAFPVWRHKKTNSFYHVIGIARCSTNGDKEGKENAVIYFSIAHQSLNYREISEFLDGRFEPVLPTKTTEDKSIYTTTLSKKENK